MPSTSPLRTIAVADLRLDAHNPRLPESYQGAKQRKLLGYLHEFGVLDELAQSFIDNRYFVAEPLIVTPERGKYTVLEGNRRLATLMILHGLPDAEGFDFGDIAADEDVLEELRKVPCYAVDDRQQVVPFIGFRHIGGLKMWHPEAKARYILQQVDEAHEDGSSQPFLDVARRVGSNSQSIRGSYTALAILRHARDKLGLQVSGVLHESRFGVWHRLLSSPEVRDFIHFGEASTYLEIDQQLQKLSKARLDEVLKDLQPTGGAPKPLLSDSRHATEYGRVLTNREAREVLRRTRDLELARQLVEGIGLAESVRKLKSRASVLREQIARAEVDEELTSAIEELYVEVRQLRALARATD